MPTFEFAETFRTYWQRLSPEEKALVMRMVREKFVPALNAGQNLSGLGIRRFRRLPGVYEIRWAADGRALFMFGDERVPGEKHIIWIAVGDHSIYDR